MRTFSKEFKTRAVQKFFSRESRTVKEICQKIGVANSSIYTWVEQYGIISSMKKTDKRPQDWTASEKLKAVIDFEKLSEDQQGEFLRREGLHSENIETWKRIMQAGLDPHEGKKAFQSELSQLRAQNKALQRDLNKKDKALAEVTALLILKKKADLIWGTEENE